MIEFGNKGVNPLLALDHETQGGDLAGSVTDGLVFEADVLGLDELRLKSRKSDTQFEIQNLTHFHCQGGFGVRTQLELVVVDLANVRLHQR